MNPARPVRRAGASRAPGDCVQAWVELRAEDPEAVSALAVARARLADGRRLAGLRRLRLFELAGLPPGEAGVEELLLRSTWFYNPHKERCMVRANPRQGTPALPGERAVLVFERGGERRPAAERWWLHETGRAIQVREGLAWLLRFEPGEGAAERAAELAVLGGRRRGLLCNPHAQEHRLAGGGEIPLPWIGAEGPGAGEGRMR